MVCGAFLFHDCGRGGGEAAVVSHATESANEAGKKKRLPEAREQQTCARPACLQARYVCDDGGDGGIGDGRGAAAKVAVAVQKELGRACFHVFFHQHPHKINQQKHQKQSNSFNSHEPPL